MLGWRLLWREWRSGALWTLLLSVALTVTIATGITGFADRVQRALVAEGHRFLAADRVLSSSRPIPEAWLAEADRRGLARAATVQFATMAQSGEALTLVSTKAVSTRYPLRGTLQIRRAADAGPVTVDHGPPPGEAWVDERLHYLLDVDLGERVTVGRTDLRLSAFLLREPDRGGEMAVFGTRLMMHTADVPASGVIQPGSRIQYQALFSGPPDTLAAFEAWLKPQLADWHRWVSLEDSRPRIAKAIERAGRFLLLASMLALVLAGLAAWLSLRQFTQRQVTPVALLKVLGGTSGHLLRLYGIRLCLIWALATALGWLGGLGLEAALLAGAERIPGLELPPSGWAPYALGAAAGALVVLAFAGPALWALHRVSPARLLQHRVGTGVRALWLGLPGVVLYVGLLLWFGQDLRLTAPLLGALGVAVVLPLGLTYGLLRVLRPRLSRLGQAGYLAISGLWRRRYSVAAQATVFGLTLLVLMTLWQFRSALLDDWRRQLPPGTPNYFILNLQSYELPEFEALLDDEGLTSAGLYPIVRGRLTHIDGEPVTTRVSKDDPDAGSVNRELNLTWADTLPEDNTVLAGQWWDQHEGPGVSVESELAERLGIGVGSKLRFDIAGDTLAVPVASIRSLDWETMRPNFYMIFPPGMLEDFGAGYITSFHLPDARRDFLATLVRRFPTAVLIDMDLIIDQIQSTIDRISLALEIILWLTLAAGLLVLVAGLRVTLAERAREQALLKTLGTPLPALRAGLLGEFLLLGGWASIMAVLGGVLAVGFLSQRILDEMTLGEPGLWLLGLALGPLIVGIAGSLITWPVLRVPPTRVLQVEE